GIVLRDLFQSDDGGWLQDAALLDRLAAEKLKVMADEIANEGWKWIEVAVSFPYGVTHGLRELEGTPIDRTTRNRRPSMPCAPRMTSYRATMRTLTGCQKRAMSAWARSRPPSTHLNQVPSAYIRPLWRAPAFSSASIQTARCSTSAAM